jgi:1,4-dihydroxy-2-naphthoate octaprenyltransferase
MQSGAISEKQMRRAMLLCSLITLALGISLLVTAFGKGHFLSALLMLVVGLAAIWAAVKYTLGKNAYGYRGLGDVFVLFFFGPVAVCGVSFLHLKALENAVLLPALGYGFLAAGVLNINNMRDRENDRDSGKNTLIVKIGGETARSYHFLLVLLSLTCYTVYVFLASGAAWLALASFLPVLVNTFQVLRYRGHPAGYNRFLKGLAVSSLLSAVLFVFCLFFFS